MKRRVFALILFAAIMMGLAVPGTVYAANKLEKVAGLKFANNQARNNMRGAEIFATELKPDKLSAKSMTLSGTVYIPKKALKSKNDSVMISALLGLWYFPVVQGTNPNAGMVYGKYDIILKLNKKKKVTLKKMIDKKESKAGKYASVKKKGKYYVVTLKKIPMNGDFLDAEDQPAEIDTTNKYILNPGFGIFSTTRKAWGGAVYQDNIELKSGTMTQKITFNKKDYQGTYATNWAQGGDKKVTIVSKVK